MSTNIWMIGHRVELPEMLDGRERRALRQRSLREKYQSTLVCFTLNVAGPVKVFPLSEEAFAQAAEKIRETLWRARIPILFECTERDTCGWEAYFAVDADPMAVKGLLTELEEREAVGRLYDIDVLRPNGTKVSRTEIGYPERRCLICGGDGSACARSRAHTVEELQNKTAELFLSALSRGRIRSEMVGRLCRQAMLLEVYTTPKPGLVDRNNNGAHRDMDIPLFEKSTQVLEPFFAEYAETGKELYEEPAEEILRCIRPIGIRAEEAMYAATGGVNTHKGMIFSLGILATATGYCAARSGRAPFTLDEILRTSALIAAPAWRYDFERLPAAEKDLTAGERQYRKYGLGGIREEAGRGFPSVRAYSWPILSRALQQNIDWNQAGAMVLLNLIAHVADSNMIARSSVETASSMQDVVRDILNDPEGVKASRVLALDEEFIRKNLSPGGCADLLALTYYLYEIACLIPQRR